MLINQSVNQLVSKSVSQSVGLKGPIFSKWPDQIMSLKKIDKILRNLEIL